MNALAEGGPVRGGKAYIVGEKGPELFVPNRPGRPIRLQDLVDRARDLGIDLTEELDVD